MSTRSNVGIKVGNKFRYIYVHFDGYPTGVGRILKTHYTDPTKVEKLVSLGDCSILGSELSPAKEHFDDMELKDPNGSLFYGRDRGESNVEAKVMDWDDYLEKLDKIIIEYVYVFEDGKWIGYESRASFKESFDEVSGESVFTVVDKPMRLIEEEEYEYA